MYLLHSKKQYFTESVSQMTANYQLLLWDQFLTFCLFTCFAAWISQSNIILLEIIYIFKYLKLTMGKVISFRMMEILVFFQITQ